MGFAPPVQSFHQNETASIECIGDPSEIGKNGVFVFKVHFRDCYLCEVAQRKTYQCKKRDYNKQRHDLLND